MDIRPFFESHFDEETLSDPRWTYCYLTINVKASDEDYRQFLSGVKQLELGNNVCIVKRDNRDKTEPFVTRSKLLPNARFHIMFRAQRRIFVQGIDYYCNSQRHKAVKIHGMDRVISFNHKKISKIVPNVFDPTLHQSVNNDPFITFRLLLNFRYWPVFEFVLTSSDNKAQLIVNGETFDLTDEQLVNIIY